MADTGQDPVLVALRRLVSMHTLRKRVLSKLSQLKQACRGGKATAVKLGTDQYEMKPELTRFSNSGRADSDRDSDSDSELDENASEEVKIQKALTKQAKDRIKAFHGVKNGWNKLGQGYVKGGKNLNMVTDMVQGAIRAPLEVQVVQDTVKAVSEQLAPSVDQTRRKDVEQFMEEKGWLTLTHSRDLNNTCIHVPVPSTSRWNKYVKYLKASNPTADLTSQSEVRVRRLVGLPTNQVFLQALTYTVEFYGGDGTQTQVQRYCYDVRRLFFYVLTQLTKNGHFCDCSAGDGCTRAQKGQKIWCTQHWFNTPWQVFTDAKDQVLNPAYLYWSEKQDPNVPEPDQYLLPLQMQNIFLWFNAYKSLVNTWENLKSQSGREAELWRETLRSLDGYMVPAAVYHNGPYLFVSKPAQHGVGFQDAFNFSAVGTRVRQIFKAANKLVKNWLPFINFVVALAQLVLCGYLFFTVLPGTAFVKLLLGPLLVNMGTRVLQFVNGTGGGWFFNYWPDWMGGQVIRRLAQVAPYTTSSYVLGGSFMIGATGLVGASAFGFIAMPLASAVTVFGGVAWITTKFAEAAPTLDAANTAYDYVDQLQDVYNDDMAWASLSIMVIRYLPQFFVVTTPADSAARKTAQYLANIVTRIFDVFYMVRIIWVFLSDLYQILEYGLPGSTSCYKAVQGYLTDQQKKEAKKGKPIVTNVEATFWDRAHERRSYPNKPPRYVSRGTAVVASTLQYI